jgi:hypothetical protein
MLLRFISETCEETLKIIFLVLWLVSGISWRIISRKFEKINDKNFKKLDQSVFLLPLLIMVISIGFLLSSSWQQIPEFNRFHSIFYIGLSIIFGGSIYDGITTASVYKKTKGVSFLIIGILCSSLSAFGFALSLFKVLQMFHIVV